MNKLFTILALAGLISFSGCKKTEAKKTTVEIVVRDAFSVKSNFTVYQIDDTKYNLYGTDPVFKDAQSVTDGNGLATFLIDDLDFVTGGQRTFYFFVKYTLAGVNKTKSLGVTLSEGDKKAGTLLLD